MHQNYIIFLLMFCVTSFSAHAKMYKWVDEFGQTHFGDKIPEQYLDKEHREINEQGAIIKKIDALPTEEEKAEVRKQAQLKKEREHLLKEQRKRDRVLVDTYTTERDLIAARDARFEAVDSQIQLSDSIIENTQRKLEKTEKTIENIEKSGRKVPENFTNNLKREQKQLATYKNVAAGHKKKRAKISIQFEDYIARFRELMDAKNARRAARQEKTAKQKSLAGQ